MDGGDWNATARERPAWVGDTGWFRPTVVAEDLAVELVRARLGDHVDHAAERIRAVECRARPLDDLDALDEFRRDILDRGAADGAALLARRAQPFLCSLRKGARRLHP